MVGAQRRCAGKEGGGIRLMGALRGEQRGNGRYAEWRVLVGVRRPPPRQVSTAMVAERLSDIPCCSNRSVWA